MKFEINPQNKKILALTASIFVLVAVGAGSYTFGYNNGSASLMGAPVLARLINVDSTGEMSSLLDDPGAKVDFGNFWKTWNILDKNFTPSSTTTKATSTTEARIAGAIAGLAASYEDPYTVFIPKAHAAVFKEQVNGEFEGIGAALVSDKGNTTVAALLPNSPAGKAGLVVGDRILAVDGVPTVNQDLAAIIPHIRGPKGTVVALTIMGAKAKREKLVEVTRGTVIIPTTATRVISAAKDVIAAAVAKARVSIVPGADKATVAAAEQKATEVAKQKFFVLQLATFAKSSIDAFIADLHRFAQSDTKYLVIDLRNNPGGYMDVAVDLASYFLPKDAIVVSERTGATGNTTEYRSKGHDSLGSMSTSSRRIVVLVNKNSASASEILAGALQDHHVAKVVGETSFGKGSVQTLIDIGDVGSLKITIARWYTPSGKNISHTGIVPDVVVDVKNSKYASSTDPFMDAAVETLLDDAIWK